MIMEEIGERNMCLSARDVVAKNSRIVLGRETANSKRMK